MPEVDERVTFCRICEAACGMVATVEDGEVVKLRPDKAHPLSRGWACPKGIAMLDVHNDPDRVLTPLKRVGGEHVPIGWDQALDEIGERLGRVIVRHGRSSVGWYMGNPGAFSYSHPIWVKGFLDALGSAHYYTASSQDVSNRFAASALLYGSPAVVAFPDLSRTDFLLCIGANPLVSHGSLLTAPRIKDRLRAIVERGGRVVVVDPRRSETARQFEHVSVQPDADAWLLLSLLHVVFAEDLQDRAAIARQAVGAGALQSLVRDFPPEATEDRTGVPADDVRALARDLATAKSAAVYGRTGTCLGRFGTTVAYLMDALTLVTGNLDRPGGMVFNRPPVSLEDLAEKVGMGYDTRRSRVGAFPDVLGAMPASLIPEEITTPGDGALRALFVSAGNPVLSVPNGPAMKAALDELDLLVSLDFYVTETNRDADYVLPATTFLEREDLPAALLGFYVQPFVQWTEAVVAPRGQARQEWEIIEAIAARIGVIPNPLPLARRLRLRVKPRRMIDVLLRAGPGGLSLRTLRRHPHGLVLDEHVPTGLLDEKVRHPDGRVRLDAAPVLRDLDRLATAPADDPAFPLKLIGLRELRSHNSWMHNAPMLMRGDRVHRARVHPEDAAACGLEDGALVRVVSKDGTVEVPATLTDEVARGVVALPHGWGHHGGWQLANAAGGVNTNVLAGNAVEDLEPLAGMAFLNGIPIRLEAVVPAGTETGVEAQVVGLP